jgi:hypothetical protein
MRPALSFALGLALLLPFPSAAVADDFWQAWGDGKAELDGYALVQPRYGHPRAGTAVMIFVTEDFSDSLRVKADPGKHPASDVYPVLKLNVVRDFQTGIYDYNLMSSTFARTEPPGAWPLVKTSFSSQEWCGHVYAAWVPRGGRLESVSHSYFDGEADQTGGLPFPPGGVVEEMVPILVRGLRGPWLQPGEQKTVPFLPSLMRARLGHRPPAWGEATVRRAATATPVASVLGNVRAVEWTVEERGGDTTTFTVEEAAPHRIVAWKTASGESGRLLGSARLAYWKLNQPGGEESLKLLGLPVPRAAR